MGVMDGLRRASAAVVRSSAEIEAQSLREGVDRSGATPCEELVDRQIARIAGTVRSVTTPPETGVPSLVADVFDGGRIVRLVFVGRRRIRGITPGRYLVAWGRVCHRGGTPTIHNPGYELRTGHG